MCPLTYREKSTTMSLRAQRRNLMPSDRMQPPNQRHEIAPQEYSFASAHSAASVAGSFLAMTMLDPNIQV